MKKAKSANALAISGNEFKYSSKLLLDCDIQRINRQFLLLHEYALGLPLLTQIKRNILLCDHLIKIELTMRTLDDKGGESILFVISLASRFFLIGRSVMVLMLKFRNDNRNTKQTVHF